MQRRPVVVDGSNLATEGRSVPSLSQLDEAVRAWLAENPDDEVIVVVDASFSYRVDESERAAFEEAEDAGEVISPPAGAVGRGDGFLLRIADRADATVLSNDSFQEFHGEYPWLFESGRLVGGKPVPGVGWIFTPRTPVRGPKSRIAVRDARRSRKPARSEPVVEAIAEATAEAMGPDGAPAAGDERRRRRSQSAAPESVNEPLPFVKFIAEHRLGTEVEGTVDSFTSHGAFVMADGARCYVPVSGLGDPPPRSAKTVLTRGETRSFVVQALDPPRRGIELALPEVARVAGAPTDETVEAEIGARARGRRPAEGGEPVAAGERPRRRRSSSRRRAAGPAQPEVSGAVPVAPAVEVPGAEPPAPTAPDLVASDAVAAGAAAPEVAPSDAAEAPPAAPAPRKRAPRARKAKAAADAPVAAEGTKATKAAKAGKAGKAGQAGEAVEAFEAKEATKATKARKAAKTPKATKTTKATKATSATKATKTTKEKATTAKVAEATGKVPPPGDKAAKGAKKAKAAKTKKASKAAASASAEGPRPSAVS